MFLGRNVHSCRRTLVVLVPGRWFRDDQLRNTGAEACQPVLQLKLLFMGLGRAAGSGFRWKFSAHRYASWPGLPAFPGHRLNNTCCVAVWGPPRETLGLVPITVVSPCVPRCVSLLCCVCTVYHGLCGLGSTA